VPSVPSLNDNFLHVLEAGDANMPGRSPTVLLSGTGVVGARVGEKIAVFSSAESTLSSGSLTIDQAGQYWVLLCDLNPGASYTFTSTTSATMTASSAGTIYLQISVPSAGSRLAFTSGGAVLPPAPPGAVRMLP
jgi:hypothetical protein